MQMQNQGYSPLDPATTLDNLEMPPTNARFVEAAFGDREGNTFLFWSDKSFDIYFPDTRKHTLKSILESRKKPVRAISKIVKEWKDEKIFYKTETFTYARVNSFSLTDPKIFFNLFTTPISLLVVSLLWYFIDVTKALTNFIPFVVGLVIAIISCILQRKKFKEEIYSLVPW